MRTFRRSSLPAVGALLTISAIAYSQGSGSSRSDPQRATRPQTPDEFYQSFWSHLVKKDAAYNTWKVLARDRTDHDVENPHSATSKTYANKIAAGDPENLPAGSILVREDYDENKKRTAFNVLYRVKDYDKEHGNWYWLKYGPDGTIARTPDKKAIAGKVTSCIDCHAKADGKDFVFSNDGDSPSKIEKSEKSNSKSPTKE